MLCFFKYLRYYTRLLLLQKYFVLEQYSLINLKEIILFVALNDLKVEDDMLIIEFLMLLEKITGQKAVVKQSESKYIGTKKIYTVLLKVSLRKYKLLRFFAYCSYVVFPLYIKRYGKLVRQDSMSVNTKIFINDYKIFFNMSQIVLKGNLEIVLVNNYIYMNKSYLNDFYKLLNCPFL